MVLTGVMVMNINRGFQSSIFPHAVKFRFGWGHRGKLRLIVLSSRYLSRPLGSGRGYRGLLASQIDDIFNFPDTWFRQTMRVTYTSFERIHLLIADCEVFASRSFNKQAPVHHQLAVGLHRLGMDGNGVSVGQMAKQYRISEGSVHNYTIRVLVALYTIRKDHLRWPDAEERHRIAHQIGCRSPFANCVGFMDGSFIKLTYRPPTNGFDYMSYKGTFSLNCMAIVDYDRRFRYEYLGWAGSTHDSRVFRSSKVRWRSGQLCSTILIALLPIADRSTTSRLLQRRGIHHRGLRVSIIATGYSYVQNRPERWWRQKTLQRRSSPWNLSSSETAIYKPVYV
jgi:hypothetical protein